METIISYLDNMFKNMPKTSEMNKLKEEFLANMEDKYHELKRNGKTENEAIGIVISEFGNIDELIEEFEIEQRGEVVEESFTFMSEEEIYDYLRMNKRFAKMIGLGTVLCILAPAILVLFNQLMYGGVFNIGSEGFDTIAGLIPFFLFIAIAVGIFIYASMGMEKYKYIEHGVDFSNEIRTILLQKNEDFQPVYVKSLIAGVLLMILSPITLIIINFTVGTDTSSYGVFVLLCMVALAIYIFIYHGVVRAGYRKLLGIGEYSTKEKEQNKGIAAVAAIIFPLATCIFLISGFVFDAWAINWLIFLIAGILFSMFSGAYNILKADGK